MRVRVGILTHNAIAHLRFELLEETIRSTVEAFPSAEIFVMDNGSTDGTDEWVVAEGSARSGEVLRRWRGFRCVSEDGNTTPGRGENRLCKLLVPRWWSEGSHAIRDLPDDELLVFSDDDMRWKPGAEDKLIRFWRDAPDDIVIVSGLLEPVWHWNTPREVVEAGGVRVLVRDSAPNAAWTMRARHVERVFPLVETFGQDYEACQRLLAAGKRVAQIDLADHLGWGSSTYGNDAIAKARPLDREFWGV